MMIVRVKHLSLCSVFLKKRPQEAGPPSAVLGMILSGRNGLEGDKLVKRLDQLIVGQVHHIVCARTATSDVPD
jgi:hypothetical protein